MFTQHQPIIGEWARERPSHFARVGLLCVLSARQRWETVGEQMQAVLAGDTRDLWAWKYEAWVRMQEFATGRQRYLNDLADRGATDTELLAHVAGWYGLGYVKGGFLLQLLYGRVGCLDSRNKDEFGLERFPSPVDAWKSRVRQARRYVRQCRALGDPSFLWDNWCAGYAQSSARLTTAWDVSAEHCRILGLDPGADPEEIPYDGHYAGVLRQARSDAAYLAAACGHV